MMVTREQFKRGASAFFANECADKASGIGKFASYFLMPSIPGMVDKYVDMFKDMGVLDDIMQEDMIDLELVEARARNAMRQCGHIDMFGFKFDESDISKMADYVKRA